MKKLNVIPALLVIICVGFLIEIAEAQRADQAYLIRTFDVSNPDLLDIRTSGGFVQVKGSDRDDVRVEMYVRRGGRYHDDTDTSLDDYEIEIEQIGNKVKAHASRESGGAISARTSGGSINANMFHVGDHVELRTSGGRITIAIPEGNGYELDLRGSRVQTELKNFSGEVERNKVKGVINDGGPVIRARTSGGSVRINYI